VIIAWLIGYTVIELTRRDGFRGATSFVLGSILKYASLVLTPVVIASRRWRTLGWTIALGVVALIGSLLIMGTGPYRVFITEIAPTLGRTTLIGENQALYRFLLDAAGATREDALPRAMEIVFRVAQLGSLLIIVGLIFIAGKIDASRIMAGALALVSWLLIFSPIFWEHYHAYLAPFWGWLVYQGGKSKLRASLAGLAIVLAYVPSSLIAHQLHLPRLPEPIFSHLLWSAVIMLALAVMELRSRDAPGALSS
jgi:hypothetical protein